MRTVNGMAAMEQEIINQDNYQLPSTVAWTAKVVVPAAPSVKDDTHATGVLLRTALCRYLKLREITSEYLIHFWPRQFYLSLWT